MIWQVAREDNLFSGRHNDSGSAPNTQHETESENTELEEVQSDTTDGTMVGSHEGSLTVSL